MNESPEPDGGEIPDILDIYIPEPEPNFWLMALFIVLGLAAIAGIVWLLIHFIREDRRRRQRDASPRSIALAQLTRLESEAAGMEPNTFALRVSEIVKDYLHASHGDRFRFETAQEFLRRITDGRGSSLPAAIQEAIAGFVTMCEELKFGRPGDAAERCAPLPDQARRIFQPTAAASIASPASTPSRPTKTNPHASSAG
jgi:uncharacterized protein (DUF2267 family)